MNNFFHGCFNWMIPHLYLGNSCFTKHPRFFKLLFQTRFYLGQNSSLLKPWRNRQGVVNLVVRIPPDKINRGFYGIHHKFPMGSMGVACTLPKRSPKRMGFSDFPSIGSPPKPQPLKSCVPFHDKQRDQLEKQKKQWSEFPQ